MFETRRIKAFSTPRNCHPISHLVFADDVVIFT